MKTKENTTNNNPELLGQLVRAAQNNDKQAIEQLCEMFKPMIYKAASNSYFQDFLGEDLLNEAWVIFIAYIKKYSGNDFEYLPGLLRIHLRYELLKRCKKLKDFADAEQAVNCDNEDIWEVPDDTNKIIEFEGQHWLREMFKKLPKRQLIIISLICLEGKSLKEASEIMNEPYESVRSLYRRGIRSLKKL